MLQETLDRNGARGDLAAVASAGGGARIPLITTTLSEHFGVPVITTAQPELTSAIGGGLQRRPRHRRRGATRHGRSGRSAHRAAAAAVAATQMAPEVHADEMGSGGSSGLAWSEADDIPDVVAPTDPVRLRAARRPPTRWAARVRRCSSNRRPTSTQADRRRTPVRVCWSPAWSWCCSPIAVAVWFVLRNNESTPSPSSTTVTTTAPPAAADVGGAATAGVGGAGAAAPGGAARHADDHPGNRRRSRRPGAAATASDERGAPATAADVGGPAARRRSQPSSPSTAAAAHPDAAVPDHPGSALRSGTRTSRRRPRLSAMTQTDGLLFNPNTYDPEQFDAETRRLLRATIDFFEGQGKKRLLDDDLKARVARRLRRLRQAREAVRDVPDAVGVRRRRSRTSAGTPPATPRCRRSSASTG